MRILLIDDDEVTVAAMHAALSKAGHEVISTSCTIGLAPIIFRERIDVVVVELELAAFRGDRLVDLFRKQRRLDKLGVVLVGEQPQKQIEALCAMSGADAAVSKSELELLPRNVQKAYSARHPAAISNGAAQPATAAASKSAQPQAIKQPSNRPTLGSNAAQLSAQAQARAAQIVQKSAHRATRPNVGSTPSWFPP